jgi:predicted membrane protein
LIVIKIKKYPLNYNTLYSLAHYLWIFLIVDVVLELLEIISMKYEALEEIEIIEHLLAEKIAFTFYGIQLTMGALIPFILLLLVGVMKNRDKLKVAMVTISSVFIVIGVFAMRWNVVIGGQEISKSLAGTLTYEPVFFSQEGVLPAIIILILPLIILRVITYILPPWKDMIEENEEAVVSPE